MPFHVLPSGESSSITFSVPPTRTYVTAIQPLREMFNVVVIHQCLRQKVIPARAAFREKNVRTARRVNREVMVTRAPDRWGTGAGEGWRTAGACQMLSCALVVCPQNI